MDNLKGVVHSNEPTESYHPTLSVSSTQHVSRDIIREETHHLKNLENSNTKDGCPKTAKYLPNGNISNQLWAQLSSSTFN